MLSQWHGGQTDTRSNRQDKNFYSIGPRLSHHVFDNWWTFTAHHLRLLLLMTFICWTAWDIMLAYIQAFFKHSKNKSRRISRRVLQSKSINRDYLNDCFLCDELVGYEFAVCRANMCKLFATLIFWCRWDSNLRSSVFALSDKLLELHQFALLEVPSLYEYLNCWTHRNVSVNTVSRKTLHSVIGFVKS